MSILRRLFGAAEPGAEAGPGASPPLDASATSVVSASEAAGPDDDDRSYERELMRAEAERLASDLLQRQMRYADRSWTPPPQGGARRADDADAGGSGS